MKKLTYLSALVLGVSLAAAYCLEAKPTEPGKGSSQAPTPVFCALKRIPFSAVHHSQQALPRRRNVNGTSSNWGGYAAIYGSQKGKKNSQGTFDNVSGTWVVPNVSSSSSANTYSSTWVGIDGYSSSSVEQLGTEDDWTPSGQQHYAWFEMYPKAAYEIVGFPVNPGDHIGAGVSWTGGAFVLGITNLTHNTYYIVPASYTRLRSAARSSAEWISEAPFSGGVLPLANFGTVTFSDCRTSSNGHVGSISDPAWTFDAITMQTSGGVVKATPSGLSSGGTSFHMTWSHE